MQIHLSQILQDPYQVYFSLKIHNKHQSMPNNEVYYFYLTATQNQNQHGVCSVKQSLKIIQNSKAL